MLLHGEIVVLRPNVPHPDWVKAVLEHNYQTKVEGAVADRCGYFTCAHCSDGPSCRKTGMDDPGCSGSKANCPLEP
jgi:hypothetical protein